jgi:hypothetical protein
MTTFALRIGLRVIVRNVGPGRPAAEQAVHDRYEEERKDRGDQQAADNRSAEWCVLLAALAQP